MATPGAVGRLGETPKIENPGQGTKKPFVTRPPANLNPPGIDAEVPVQIVDLTFKYPKIGMDAVEQPVCLHNFNLTVNKGQRILVVGGNGAGKSTLLRIIAGKHLTPDFTSYVFGRDAFKDCTLNEKRSYVSCEWAQRTVAFSGHAVAYSADIAVEDMNKQLQHDFPERKAKLMKVLRINPKWRMHKLSDGQRRRVQLFMNLLKPTPLIILDEVLGVMDIISRQDFLDFLIEETDVRNATVLFATNVFDGLEDWATELLYVKRGHLQYYGPIKSHPDYDLRVSESSASPIMRMVEGWLRKEIQELEGDAMDVESESTSTKVEDLDLAWQDQAAQGGYGSGRLGGVVSS